MAATEVIRFRAHGEPVPQGSKKAWLNKKTERVMMVEDQGLRHASWRREVTAAATEALNGAPVETPLTGPVSILLTFFFFRRLFHYGTGRNLRVIKPSAPDRPAGKPDLDKLLRAVFDSLTDARVWVDDSQVVAVTARKAWVDRYGLEPDGVEVVVGVIS